MNEDYALFLTFSVIAVSVCSFLAVASWVDARRREREAHYRSEAIKKIAEMQGNISEPVLQVLREALRPKREHDRGLPPAEHRREREAFYRSEALRKIAESSGEGATMALQYLREEDRKDARRQREAYHLAGAITFVAGLGLFVFLRFVVLDEPVYLVGLIPMLIGLVLLAFGYFRKAND